MDGKHQYVVAFFTIDKSLPSPWKTWHLPQHNRTRGGKTVFCMVAVIEDTSEQRAWQQVFRCFPDYTEATSIIRCDNKEQALVRLKDSFGINAC